MTPFSPYYAVIFTSVRSDGGDEAYRTTAARMVELARQQPGFLGMDSARDGIGITVSYWESLEAIKAWKANMEHLAAQARAPEWYRHYRVRICKVERDYEGAPH